HQLRSRFEPALAGLAPDPAKLPDYLGMVKPAANADHGDYQANFAMPLGKRLGRPPREVAAEILRQIRMEDLCQQVEIAGPGFINLRVRDDRLIERLGAAAGDERLGIPKVDNPRTYVIDYSAPNVAKPMHVGHIRSTVIGDALCRVLRLLGHRVVSDNHIGDWGTQFGMIIYGYRRFLDEAAYRDSPVEELARLYRLVRQLVDYHNGKAKLPEMQQKLATQESALQQRKVEAGEKPDKKTRKTLRKLENDLESARKQLAEQQAKLAAVDDDPELSKLVAEHAEISSAVLAETAKLHAGDEENLRLWREFLPACEDEINRVYGRLGVTFDHTLGESFYNDRLGPIVDDLLERKIARESDGAICIFFPDRDVPMLIRKQDGAFLYATTDLATIRYRQETFQPDAILYVVDFRQGMHFEHLFAAAGLIGYDDLELRHVSFGTVMGEDGRPFKTREGDTVGLESLLNEAVRRAGQIVAANDDAKPDGAELSEQQRRQVAETVGIGALKYADLSQNRTSDYKFSYDKMLATVGNTATYMQYAYARVRSIFRRGNVDVDALRTSAAAIVLDAPAERALAVELLRLSEALDLTVADYRPNQLTAYLFELANRYSTFFDQCPVLKAETDGLRQSRLLLCDLTARTIKLGLELLGIDVVEQM
ncbi:MAG: arginine--tRNA ligase, partial [Candidatus Nealsonbacteria bacterium]|nr:arginine--tRNA ligase [Candidatus Nealsonbacteria bacterium]